MWPFGNQSRYVMQPISISPSSTVDKPNDHDRNSGGNPVVPLAGIEPALLSEPDFESGASTNSAKGATLESHSWYAADYTNRLYEVNTFLRESRFHETLLHCNANPSMKDLQARWDWIRGLVRRYRKCRIPPLFHLIGCLEILRRM